MMAAARVKPKRKTSPITACRAPPFRRFLRRSPTPPAVHLAARPPPSTPSNASTRSPPPRDPSRARPGTRMVAVLVPSPTASPVRSAASRIMRGPKFSSGSLRSISLESETTTIVRRIIAASSDVREEVAPGRDEPRAGVARRVEAPRPLRLATAQSPAARVRRRRSPLRPPTVRRDRLPAAPALERMTWCGRDS